MASITPLGGPKRCRNYWSELSKAVAADLRCSTEETRAKVIAARLAYLDYQRELEKDIDFQLAVRRRMNLLTARPVTVEPAPSSDWVWIALGFAALAVGLVVGWVLS